MKKAINSVAADVSHSLEVGFRVPKKTDNALDVFKRRLVRIAKRRVRDADLRHVDYAAKMWVETLDELDMEDGADAVIKVYEKE